MRTPAGFSVVRITSIYPSPGRSPDRALGVFLAWSFREFIFSALWHIGQTVNARGFVYATCCSLHTLVAHQAKRRGFGIVYCCPTAAKPSERTSGPIYFLWDLQAKKSADERTRTADLPSLRVINRMLQGFAQACKTRIDRQVSFLCLALCCTVLRSRWCQSGVNLAFADSFLRQIEGLWRVF